MTALIVYSAVMVLLPKNIAINARELIIVRNESFFAIADQLSRSHIIFNKAIFIGYAFLTGRAGKFKAGNYVLNASMSTYDIVAILTFGKTNTDIRMTIPEGFNVADIDQITSRIFQFKQGDFIRSAISSEGYLFPDTYRFSPNSSPEEIVQRMKDNFYAQTNILAISPAKLNSIIIAASILEKEVRREEDMRIVAGIISRRIELGMPLQIDATVAYGVCRSAFLKNRYCDVSAVAIRSAIAVDTPYNSYTRRGLPIGPIANPGLQAIKAVLDPKKTDFLYYLSDGAGNIIYSKTAAEHEKARQKYIL